jgi:drug/metabolite transporter (DMT)-like permease
MTGREQSYAAGVAYVLLAELGWSLSGFFVRLLPPTLDGWQINTWRGYWMAVALLCFLVARYGSQTWSRFRAIPVLALVISAVFFTAGSTLYVTSLTLVSTATISVIGAASPIFTGLLSPWVTGERPGVEAWAAALLALAGVGIIAWDGLEGGRMVGILVSILVPISFAGQTLMLRRYRGYDMVPALCLGGFACFIVAGLCGFSSGHALGGFDVDAKSVLILAAMGPLQLAIPAIYYAKGAKSVSAVTLSLIVMLDAVLNPLWPWLAFGEQPGYAALLGGTVIVGAVLISIFGGRVLNRGSRRSA